MGVLPPLVLRKRPRHVDCGQLRPKDATSLCEYLYSSPSLNPILNVKSATEAKSVNFDNIRFVLLRKYSPSFHGVNYNRCTNIPSR